MKNRVLKALSFIAVLMFTLFAMVSFIGCGDDNKGNGNDKSDLDNVTESQISMISAVKESNVELTLDSNAEEVGTGTVKIVSVKSYQYLEGDGFYGVSTDIVKLSDAENYVVGEYQLGSKKTVTLNRYDDESASGYDKLYNKYYLIGEGKIVKGPVYATEIEAKYSEVPVLSNKSKKGLFAEFNGNSAYKDLGASHTVINLPIETLIRPNELFEDGQAIAFPIDESEKQDYFEFVSNGKTYYFNKTLVKEWDREISSYYKLGSQITAIILARPNSNDETFPQKLTYAPWSTVGTRLMGLNTSNAYGFEYYVAVIEFLANRYSENNFENGYISNYVIGNEIDYARDYNRISEKHASIDTYMEEYSRLMRLANLATRKYSKDITVCMPLTQAWAGKGYVLDNPEAVQAYAPKQMVEWLNTKSKLEGDYNWGLAPHVYGYHLAQAGVYYLDTFENKKAVLGEGDMVGGINVGMTNDFNTTTKLTFSNLELLDDYLNQNALKFNNSTRSVYLTESGVSSYWNGDIYGGENIQAGIIASAYYKISQLDSIKSFNYYRAFDNLDEMVNYACFGLVKRDSSGELAGYKPAYEVFKYIDTQYSKLVADKYLKYIEYFDKNQNLQRYNQGFTSYQDLLNIFGTSHDFSDFDWNKATPVTAETVYEYEDLIDLGDVKFTSKSFLYDGTAHSLEISGTLPDGVTVSYSENNSLTDVGTQRVEAIFMKNGEKVGMRVATLEVSKIYTNKKTYAIGEKIFITPYIDSDLPEDAWIAIYKSNAKIGDDPSLYYYYFNTEKDGKFRTRCIQEQVDNLRGGITAGDYIICYFENSGYDVRYTVNITVLPSSNVTDDLTGVKFDDFSAVNDGQPHSIEIVGDLPTGISVEYENNGQTEVGTYQVVAIFKKNGVEIERRYAVLTIESATIDRLVLNKTKFEQGEDIFVTATAFADSADKSWWVGLYLATDAVESDESIYWYYVKDEKHTNATAYSIRLQTHNSSRSDYVNLPVGKYKVVLFNTSGYTVEKIVEIEIVPSTSTETGTVSANKNSYVVGEDILVTATCPENAGSGTYWVGLYLEGETPSKDVVSIYWYYVKGKNSSGSDTEHVSGTAYKIQDEELNKSRKDMEVLPAGSYKLVLFNASGEIEATFTFTIVESGD